MATRRSMTRFVFGLAVFLFVLCFAASAVLAQTSLDLSPRTDSMTLPGGTSAQRPASPANGMLRYNSMVPQVESYYSGAWQALGGAGLTLPLGTSASATNPQRSGDATTGLFSPAVNTVAIAEGGSQQVTINATGVGIGTTSPAYTLDVNNGSINAGWGFTNAGYSIGGHLVLAEDGYGLAISDGNTYYGQVYIPSGLSLRHRYHAGIRLRTSEYFH